MDFTKWQLWFHYIILTLFVVTLTHILGIHIFHTANFLPNLNTLYLFLVIVLGDLALHGILSLTGWDD